MGARLNGRLHDRLESLRTRYGASYLSSDPLEYPHRFSDPLDREVVGLVASSIAYGNVKVIRRSIERLLDALGSRPAAAVKTTSSKEMARALHGFQHRWTRAKDVACLLALAGRMIEERGSIGAFFAETYALGDMAESLRRFSERALALDHGGLYRTRGIPRDAGVRFFFPNPLTGAAKRLNMYLRWMSRPADGVDLGLWRFVRTRDLVIPLDTHIFRIGRHLGWTGRKTPGFPAAVEITRSLARFDPEDPVKYDFALSRLGILAGCPRHPRPLECELCSLAR